MLNTSAPAPRSAADAALSVLDGLADPSFLAELDLAVAAGARWIFDPQHDDVVGLLHPGSDVDALVVVYLAEEDFETDDNALLKVIR